MGRRDREEALEKFLRVGPAAYGEEIDELDDQPRAALARPARPPRRGASGRAGNDHGRCAAAGRSARRECRSPRRRARRDGRARAVRTRRSPLAETKPSSVARQGTMAGTQVRSASSSAPTRRGENRREAAASSRVGMRPWPLANRMRSGGRHMARFSRVGGGARARQGVGTVAPSPAFVKMSLRAFPPKRNILYAAPRRRRMRTSMNEPLDPSLYDDGFARQALPPRELWPQFEFDETRRNYPRRLNAAVELLDGAIARGFGPLPCLRARDFVWTYADLLEKADRIAGVLTRRLRPAVGSARAAARRQFADAGRLLVRRAEGGRNRRHDHAAAARARARPDRGNRGRSASRLCEADLADELEAARAACPSAAGDRLFPFARARRARGAHGRARTPRSRTSSRRATTSR